MKFRDRVSQAEADTPSNPAIAGRWVIEGVPDSGARHNGCLLTNGDALVPDALGGWRVSDIVGAKNCEGRFATGALHNEQDEEALLELGSLLKKQESENWLPWSTMSPLAPGLENVVRPHPLEAKIQEDLHHLEEICRNPSKHIRQESERQLVAKARRIDPRAAEVLASRTDDWEHRKVTGVQPRRILARVREEEWDLYENRLCARLIDYIATWLRRRISEVSRVLNDIFVRLVNYKIAAGGSRHRLTRICSLWGEAWDYSEGKDSAERELRELQELLYRILRLLDSPLYRNIPRSAQVPRLLRMTNLFGNDANYRAVARLWIQLSSGALSRNRSQDQVYRRNQDLRHSFDSWTMLLIVRACGQLHLEPLDSSFDQPLAPGHSLELSNGYRLTWNSDGTVQLSQGSDRILHFIPLAQGMQMIDSSVEEARSSLVRGAIGKPAWTVVLHLPGSVGVGMPAAINDPPSPDVRGAVDCICVSPFSLESVERVARVVRWAVLSRRMMSYPPRITEVPAERASQTGSWLQKRDNGQWSAVRIPDPREVHRLGLDSLLATLQSERDTFVGQLEDIKEQLRSSRGDRRLMADLNSSKPRIQQALQEVEKRLDVLERFDKEIKGAQSQITLLSCCPLCGRGGQLTPRDRDCFTARCITSGCEARWEVRIDAETLRRTPIFLPGDIELSGLSAANLTSASIEELLGSDVLALPENTIDGTLRFRPARQSVT